MKNLLKLIILILITNVILITNTYALGGFADRCDPSNPCDPTRYTCSFQSDTTHPRGGEWRCAVSPTTGPLSVFGNITPPKALQNLGFGSIGISSFANALIGLIYMLAAVIFVFILLWGAIEWLMSGGDKEKVGSAQKRLTNAIIGIIILGVTFAILDLIGIFTGFTFFN